MSLVFDLPYCFSPWVRVDAAGQPIELSKTLDDLERDAAEREEARAVVERLRGEAKPAASSTIISYGPKPHPPPPRRPEK